MGKFLPGTAIASSNLITSAWMTTICDDINFFAAAGGTAVARDLFVARQSAAQSVGSATATALTFSGEDIDTASGHSTSTNTSRYTCQLTSGTGVYFLNGLVSLQSMGTVAGDTAVAQFYRSGTALDGSFTRFATPTGGGAVSFNVAPCYTTMTTGQYVELFVTTSKAGTSGTAPASMFSVEWVGYKP